MCEKIIECKDLCKTYGEEGSKINALNGISLDVYEGEMLVILGHSGSGKSTLLNIIGGIDKPTSGAMLFKGTDIGKLKESQLADYRKDKIGFIFQFFNLLEDMNVCNNIKITPGANKDRNVINELLKKMGLYEKRHQFPSQLSGGEQQRVAVARALNKSMDVLLCDEPTGSLDCASGKGILELLETVNQSWGKTVVVITHTKEIASMADRVIVMKDGKIIDEYKNTDKRQAKDIVW